MIENSVIKVPLAKPIRHLKLDETGNTTKWQGEACLRSNYKFPIGKYRERRPGSSERGPRPSSDKGFKHRSLLLWFVNYLVYSLEIL